ncbi:uncharacterized protein [Nicotiana sylvestris]|uniref:uncharacterized protein n=1 Tax=Nicotiana sylvestris TaxID=4096 RepID=UPI00388C9C62
MAFSIGMDDGTLRYQRRLCVPNMDGLRERIMTEAHTSRYFVHPGSSKMNHDLKEVYWWNYIKKNVTDLLARCPNCQQVKAEHQWPDTYLVLRKPNWLKLLSDREGVIQFDKKGKLSSRYVGPYRIIQRVGQVAYRLEQPPEMSFVHLVFHVSMLKKVVGDLSLIVPVETIEVNEELTYEEISVDILDRQVCKLRNKEVASVKLQRRNQQVEGATWEAEEEMKKKKYPHLFE